METGSSGEDDAVVADAGQPHTVDNRVLPGKYGLRLTRDQYVVINKKPSTYVTREMSTEAQWA